MLVTVERDWFAVAFEIMPGGFCISEEAFVRHKPQLEQLPGGIIDEYQQGALRPAIFKPGVLRPIDLHQLPEAGPPLPHRVGRRLFCPLRLP